jgi:hypothetical protein
VVGQQMVREYTYAYAAVCPFDGAAFTYILPRMDGTCMTLFLQELAAHYHDHFLLVVLDGAPCHKPGALEMPENMLLEHLPPYSPELNPTENLWDDMREKFFGNLVFDSMDAVQDRLINACRFYEHNPSIVLSIAARNWITLVCC